MADKPEIFWTTANGGHWVAASAAAYDEINDRPDLFSSAIGVIPAPTEPIWLIPATLDPPEHTKYRKEMTRAMFSARALANIEADLTLICKAIADEFAHLGACDFVEAFARRLPVDHFLVMMGAPPDRRDDFLHWVGKFFRATNPDDLAEGTRLCDAFVEDWLDRQFATGTNQGQLFKAMLELEIDGRSLTRAEMHSITAMLFLGGLDTVVSQLSHIMNFLAESDAHRQFLMDHPERLSSAMEELLRRFGITVTARVVAKDIAFRGVQMKQGDLVLMTTPFPNLDRRAFKNPLKVDFNRSKRVRHWGFGNGPHICIGAHLARTQIRIALAELLPRIGHDLRVAPDAKIEIRSGGTFCMTTLPLLWTPIATGNKQSVEAQGAA
jgi:cytochrome P450